MKADLEYWCVVKGSTNGWKALEDKLASAAGVITAIQTTVRRPGFDYNKGFLDFQ